MPPAEPRRRLAHGIAVAFLAGEWRPAAMAYRAADAIAAGGLWLGQLVWNCVRHGPSTQARGAPRFREALRGRIAWLAQLHPARGQKLLALYQAIDWER